MLFTKDNLVKFLKEKKYLTPTNVSSQFEINTMISSATLGEIATEGIAKITYLKVGSSPIYYDKNQKNCLMEIGDKYLGNKYKQIYEKLKSKQILNDNSLSIQEKLLLKELKDFVTKLEINFENKNLIFWVWVLRDLKETKKQILEYLRDSKKTTKPILDKQKTLVNKEEIKYSNKKIESKNKIEPKNKIEIKDKINNFLEKNNFELIEKITENLGIRYKLKIKLNHMELFFDCYYFEKKVSQAQIVEFYISSIKPKIVFTQNITKSLIRNFKSFENLKIIEL